jgi:hypothetical protein
MSLKYRVISIIIFPSILIANEAHEKVYIHRRNYGKQSEEESEKKGK